MIKLNANCCFDSLIIAWKWGYLSIGISSQNVLFNNYVANKRIVFSNRLNLQKYNQINLLTKEIVRKRSDIVTKMGKFLLTDRNIASFAN